MPQERAWIPSVFPFKRIGLEVLLLDFERPEHLGHQRGVRFFSEVAAEDKLAGNLPGRFVAQPWLGTNGLSQGAHDLLGTGLSL